MSSNALQHDIALGAIREDHVQDEQSQIPGSDVQEGTERLHSGEQLANERYWGLDDAQPEDLEEDRRIVSENS